MRVEARAAGELEHARVGNERRERGLHVFVLDARDGFLPDEVVGRLDGVVLGS